MGQTLTYLNKIQSVVFNNPTIDTTDVNENKESTTLIWFDPNIGTKEDTEQTTQRLRLINNYVRFYTDLHQCVKYIQSIEHEQIFLITSGSKASLLLSQVSSLRQIDSIFIFCFKKSKYEHLINEYSKIIGIYVDLDELCDSIKKQVDLVDKQLQTFSFYDHNQKATKDLSKQSGEFLWYQLFNYVIHLFPNNQQSKEQMILFCQQYYRGHIKQIKLIDQFEREYRSEEAIRWYSKQSFVYSLINKALRTEDIDQLYIFRFFIHDLSESLRCEHEKLLLSNEEILTVYRGAKLDKEEFDKLKENQGKLISTNGYLSTSRILSTALAFTMKRSKRNDAIPVLFQIQCYVKQLEKNVIFADITEFSDHPNEQEVLFDLNTCFEIQSIESNDSYQLIIMNVSNEGQLITKDYIKEIEKETEEQSVSIVFGRLMCNLGEYDKSQRYFQQLLNDPTGEDLAWIEFNIGRAYHFRGEWKEARDYYDRAYNILIKSTPPRIQDSAYVLNNIGNILDDQGKYDEALHYHRRALIMREKSYPAGHVAIATSLNNIGIILYNQGKCDEALGYYQKALKMQEKCYPSGHVDIARSLNNIGNIFFNQRKYDEALHYHQPALKMREKCYPSGHVDIAHSLNNIGVILDNQKKYDEALKYHQRALEIRENSYPSGHVDIALSLNNIGCCHENINNAKLALDYYHRSLTIYEKFYPVDHPDRVRTERNVNRLNAKMVSVINFSKN